MGCVDADIDEKGVSSAGSAPPAAAPAAVVVAAAAVAAAAEVVSEEGVLEGVSANAGGSSAVRPAGLHEGERGTERGLAGN